MCLYIYTRYIYIGAYRRRKKKVILLFRYLSFGLCCI